MTGQRVCQAREVITSGTTCQHECNGNTIPEGVAEVQRCSHNSWGCQPDVDGNGIPGGSKKDAPGIGERYQGTAEAPMASKCKVETKLTSLLAE